MKKNLSQADMQKPKVGQCYRLYEGATEDYMIIRIFSINENFAFYNSIDEIDSPFFQKWDFVEFPDCLRHPLSSLEMELL